MGLRASRKGSKALPTQRYSSTAIALPSARTILSACWKAAPRCFAAALTDALSAAPNSLNNHYNLANAYAHT